MLAQRQCVFLFGEQTHWLTSLAQLTEQHSRSIAIGQIEIENLQTLTHKQAQKQLGKEFSLVIYDASEGIEPDSFGAIVGTLTAGGVFVVLLSHSSSLFQQRFYRLAEQYCKSTASFYWCEAGSEFPQLPAPQSHIFEQTNDQTNAIEAIVKVVTGHRKRPLVISSDRGRGKTSALGLAAAELIKQGKQQIIATAPSLAAVDALFKHAETALHDLGCELSKGKLLCNEATIRFIAPDKLLESLPQTDLLIIDEAAAIPHFMLEALLKQYSRLVFATTLHGYEGTGRGFALRFQTTLKHYMPDYRQVHLSQPIRWPEHDQLEAFSFDALLLNAEAVADDTISVATTETVQFSQLTANELTVNEELLNQLYGLMALAHYRTRPSDLEMLLDDKAVSCYTLLFQGNVVACAWLIEEGNIDSSLSTAIFEGIRRPNGDLLPQSLLAHSGIETAGQYRYQRIARIAVHPSLQKKGLGSELIEHLSNVLSERCDCFGASFAAQHELVQFWLKSGFQPVRLGQHQDDVSGSHALIMLKPCSMQGQQLISTTQHRLKQQWPFLLQHSYKKVSVELLVLINQQLNLETPPLTNDEHAEIIAFASAMRAYESSQYSLWRWALQSINQPRFKQLDELAQCLVMRLLVQQLAIAEVVDECQFTGRKQLINKLRNVVTSLLD
jgi:tRNA(Met) cytidine acetyltransferase